MNTIAAKHALIAFTNKQVKEVYLEMVTPYKGEAPCGRKRELVDEIISRIDDWQMWEQLWDCLREVEAREKIPAFSPATIRKIQKEAM